MKKTVGVLAHVDAGKTTFSEQILYYGQGIKTRGRVDHQDADPEYTFNSIFFTKGQAYIVKSSEAEDYMHCL